MVMQQILWRASLALSVVVGAGSLASAVEVLLNGTLEGSVAPPGWTMTQSITGQPGLSVNLVEQIDAANEPEGVAGEKGLFVRPFAGNVGAYDQQNYKTNLDLVQVVNAFANRTYTFTGHVRFAGDGDPMTNDGFSGGVTTLSEATPTGAIPSPTVTKFVMEFLDVNNALIGSPTELDLRTVTPNDNMWYTHMVSALSPANVRRVRVSAIAHDMVDNYSFQDLNLDNFTLRDSAAPTTERLSNGNLNTAGPPFGYELSGPAGFRDFANHTTNGQQGYWIRAWEGGDASLTQTVAAVPGAQYDYSVWSKWEPGYAGGLDPTGTPTTISITFLDSANAPIGSPVSLNLGANGQMNDNTWRQFMVSGTAPAGSAFVKISAGAQNMFNSLFDPQSAFFDDFSLIQTVAGVPGDYNSNGSVDAADYTVYRDNLGTGFALPNRNPANTGNVSTDDYNFWVTRFLATNSVAVATAVPEPATLMLLAAPLAGLFAAKRRR